MVDDRRKIAVNILVMACARILCSSCLVSGRRDKVLNLEIWEVPNTRHIPPLLKMLSRPLCGWLFTIKFNCMDFHTWRNGHSVGVQSLWKKNTEKKRDWITRQPGLWRAQSSCWPQVSSFFSSENSVCASVGPRKPLLRSIFQFLVTLLVDPLTSAQGFFLSSHWSAGSMEVQQFDSHLSSRSKTGSWTENKC